MVHAQTSKTSCLRMCNNLLRRLSKAQNTVLCGRISLFLARSVPFDDRSGLNIHAGVNLSNTTPIEDPDQVLSLQLLNISAHMPAFQSHG